MEFRKVLFALVATVCFVANGDVIAAVNLGCEGKHARFMEIPQPFTPDVFGRNAKILFQGDSITHGGRAEDMNHYLGHGYQAEIAMRYLGYHPDWGLSFENRGVSGHTSSNLVERWHIDAIPYTAGALGEQGAFGWSSESQKQVPDVLSILIGINDYLRTDGWYVPVEQYELNLRYMVTNSLAANPSMTIVLCQPFRLPVDNSEEFLSRQAAAERVAHDYDLVWVPFQELFSEVLAKENSNPKYWFWDAFHPTYAAHMRMADFWLEAMARRNMERKSKEGQPSWTYSTNEGTVHFVGTQSREENILRHDK